MHPLILLCTLAILIGLPAGYFLAWCFEEADRLLDEYLDGFGFVPAYQLEVWR